MPIDATKADRLRVFISYSRRDALDFADQLAKALEMLGYRTIFDREGISGGELWQARLGQMVLESDTVVFVMSPESATSPICAWEVDEASRLAKRILPVIITPLGAAKPPERLQQLNFIHFYAEKSVPGSGFGDGLVKLNVALKSDLDWLREHTRLLERATEWEKGNRTPNRMLSGADISTAKAWAARRPKDAPEPTALQLDYIKASETYEAAQHNERQRQLEERERMVRQAEVDRAERDAQQKRASRLAWTSAALAMLVALGGAAFGSYAYFSKVEVELEKQHLAAANQRLSAEMRLRVAPFGKSAYTIPEQWYKLATTNASSISFIEYSYHDKWLFSATGFIVKGRTLYEPWGDELFLVAAGHTSAQLASRKAIRFYFPAISNSHMVALGSLVWARTDNDTSQSQGIDTAVFRIAGPLPPGARPVDAISDRDFTTWAQVKFIHNNQLVEKSVVPGFVPLIILGASVDAAAGTKVDPETAQPLLTLSLANALGRAKGQDDTYFTDDKIIFTDSTTIGSSGSPVFDATDGRLVAIMQFGTTLDGPAEGGFAFSGGVTLAQVRQAILRDAEAAKAKGRLLPNGQPNLAPGQR